MVAQITLKASHPGPAPANCLLPAPGPTGLAQPRALLSGHFIAKGGTVTLEIDNLSLLWRILWPWRQVCRM